MILKDGTQRTWHWWDGVPWSPILWIIIQTVVVVVFLVQMRADIEQLKETQRNRLPLIEELSRATSTIALMQLRLATIDQRLIAFGERDADLTKTTQEIYTNQARAFVRRDGQIAAIDVEIKRLQEQQMKILQAFDNIYNQLHEHLRSSHGTGPRGKLDLPYIQGVPKVPLLNDAQGPRSSTSQGVH